MTFPTPSGQNTNGANLAEQPWQDQPITPQSRQQMIQKLTPVWGPAQVKQFMDWLNTALKKDPGLTPNQAVGIYATQRSLGPGLGDAGNVLGEVPAAAAKGAEKSAAELTPKNPITDLVSAVGKFASVFEAIFSQITKISMWRSLGWILLGAALVIGGIAWWVTLG